VTDASFPLALGPAEGATVQIGPLGVRFMVDGGLSGGGFALVEHRIAPRSLAAAMHFHQHEDEYSYVLEGRVGVHIGDDVLEARPGDLVFKPRRIPHAFWNPGDEPARLLEIISPAGFERYFAEAAELLPPHVAEIDFAALRAVQDRYGLSIDAASVETLVERHGLNPPA
jgi:mannose-6-phosphate isomerase-like protein (cupin superfamily)